MILGYRSYHMAENTLQVTIEQQLKSETQFTAEVVGQVLEAAKEYLKVASKNGVLAEASMNGDDADKNNAYNYLTMLQKENSQLLESLVLVDAYGTAVLSNQEPSMNADFNNRDYVQKALQGSETVSEVITSKVTGETVVAIAEPILVDDLLVGVLVGTINFENITKHAAEIKVGENGYAYMMNQEGLIVYHPDESKILKENMSDVSNEELKALVEKMKAGETSHGFYTYEGDYKFVTFQPAGKWVLASTANHEEYMAPALAIRNQTIIIVVIALILAMIAAYFIAAKITNPIKQLEKLMDKAGNGDLTVESKIKTGDEIEALGESFNQMIIHQSDIISQVRISAQELAASSEEMAASSEQASAATQQISASMQQVAHDSEIQNSSIVEVSEALVQLASLVQLAKIEAKESTDTSTTTMNTANYGRNKVEETVEAMDTISQKSSDIAIVVQEINKLSARIGEIVTTINAIAAQTDLLALNAAIEAARAGEHGRGFAVVAEEVRKLSEESHKGAEEIASLVGEMVNHSQKAVESMKFGSQAVENGVKIVNETDRAFADIIQAVEDTVRNIEEILNVTNDEVATSDQIVNLIDTVASITEKTVSSIQEVASAAEEQTASIETIAAGSEEVSALAVSSENLVERFIINERNLEGVNDDE